MHATLPCEACHINNVYKGTPVDCYSCHTHTIDFQNTNNPPHVQLGLPHDCATCHTTVSWSPATFDHALYAHYPLTGAHATVACAQCHVNNNYTSTPTACYACHQTDFTGTTNPNHVAGGFPTDCSLCHTTANWTTSTFNHAAVFPLTGAHATVPCAQCHTNNNYTTLPTNCYGCHQADFTGATNPGHVAAAFPTTCDTCHNTTNWTTVTFNHATYANYPLTGVHATLTCAQCHTNNNYTSTPTACYSCHQADFTGTTSPNHVTSGLPDRLRLMPHDKRLEPVYFRSLDCSVPTYWRAYHRSLRPVPHKQQLHNGSDGLLLLPQGRLQRHNQSESRYGWLPDYLRHLP